MSPGHTDNEIAERIAARLRSQVDCGEIAGVLVAAGDSSGTKAVVCYGHARLDPAIPIDNDSLFWIASETKPITAMAFGRLVAEGLCDFGDPVHEYPPEFRRSSRHSAITVANLLSNTSGLPFRSRAEPLEIDTPELADRVRLYAGEPLEFFPGTGYLYSNAGFNTVGRIIEVVAGSSYQQFLADEVLGPLGMNETVFVPDHGASGRVAKIYGPHQGALAEEANEQLSVLLHGRHRTASPAGGLFSTGSDLLTFCRLVLNGGRMDRTRLVPPDVVANMTTRQTPATASDSYGYGWHIDADAVWCSGAAGTMMRIDFSAKMVAS
jgi:CubicO group peptidase (beta-lactamase class C family)